MRIWALLLLGEAEPDDSSEIDVPLVKCGEQHVLEADVSRTRADLDVFR